MASQRERTPRSEPIENLTYNHSAGAKGPVDVVWLAELRQRKLSRSISAPNRLDFHMIQFVTSGDGRHWVDFEELELRCGDLHHVRPGQVHSFDSASSHDAFVLFFKSGALEGSDHLTKSIATRLSGVPHPGSEDFAFLESVLHAQRTLDHGRGVLHTARLGPSLLRVILEGIEALLTLEEAREDPAILRAREAVTEFQELIAKNYADSRSLKWYSSQLHMSERTIARACKRLGRPTPKGLIDERTALEARRLLSITRESVESIAHTMGFTEATNFVKFFRRITGHTPEAFRRSLD